MNSEQNNPEASVNGQASSEINPQIKSAPEPISFPIVGIGASAGGLAAFATTERGKYAKS